jgi:metal-sulfur cluster biosynthetic enzyme
MESESNAESGTDPQYCAYTSYDSLGIDPAGLPNTGEGATGIEREIWDALYEIEDPEMPVSIVDLGLIYGVEVDGREATVHMTLTYTGCPAREFLTRDVREATASVEGIDAAEVDLVWSPPWSVDLVTEAGRESLREFGVSI